MRLAVFHYERALQSAARSLAGNKRIRFTRIERVVVATAIEDETEIAHHHTGTKCAVKTRREADHVARTIDHRNVAGVAFMIGFAGYRYLDRSIEQSLI